MNNYPYTPEQLLEAVKEFIFKNYDRRQGWLIPSPINHVKPFYSLVRTNRAGTGIRKPVLSDFYSGANCALLTGHDLAGLSPFMVSEGKLMGNKSGTGAHKEIDRLIKSKAFENFLPGVNIAKGWDDLVSVGFRGLEDPLRGKMDIYDLTTGTIIEIKMFQDPLDLPDFLPDRAMGQVASYLHGNIPARSKYGTPEQSKAFVLYLPSELSFFNPSDNDTFRVFTGTKESTEQTFKTLKAKYEKNIWLYRTYGLPKISEHYQCRTSCVTCHNFRKFREDWIVDLDRIRGKALPASEVERITIEYFEELDEYAA